eukprot:m.373683 g.373683  ORF g.373683 m.373683 type:complete len:703 (+) comp56154_c0_seq2:141-2249(+)
MAGQETVSATASTIRASAIVRSFSERRARRPHDPASVDIPLVPAPLLADADAVKSSTLPVRSSFVNLASQSPSNRRRAFSFKRSMKNRQDPPIDERKPIVLDFKSTSASSLDASEAKSGSESKGGRFKKFLMSFRGKGKKEKGSASKLDDRVSDNSQTISTSSLAKADYFKSKKGKFLWVSRYGQEEINLTSVSMDQLVMEEAHALQIFAIHSLSDLLPTPVMYDPFSPRAHAVDLMHRRSTFGERFKNAFRSRSSTASSTHSSPTLRPASVNSDLAATFGRPLEDVIIEDRMRTGDVHLRIPLLVSVTAKYLQEHGLRTIGIFRVSGSMKRVRSLIEAFDSGITPDLTQAQPVDVAGVLKYFLRELPEPLIISPLFSSFLDVAHIEKAADKLLSLRLLTLLLPSINRSILEVLLSLLSSVAKLSEEPNSSKMNSHNLARVMAPNLLRDTRPDSRFGKLDKKLTSSGERLSGLITEDSVESSTLTAEEASEVIEMMIDYSDHLFTIPADLRDQALVFHASQNPQIVSDVVRKLIERSQGFPRSFTSPPDISISVPSMADFAAPKQAQSLHPGIPHEHLLAAHHPRPPPLVFAQTRSPSNHSLAPPVPSPLRSSSEIRLAESPLDRPLTPPKPRSPSIVAPSFDMQTPMKSPVISISHSHEASPQRLSTVSSHPRKRLSVHAAAADYAAQHGLQLDEDGGTLV